MADEEYSDICIKLDALGTDMLNLMQRILYERQHFDSFLKNGFTDIAKSRYVMGSNSVSLLQVNESQIAATCKVQFEDSFSNDVPFKRFSMFQEEQAESNPDTLRKRHSKKGVDNLVENIKNCNISDNVQKKNHEKNVIIQSSLDPLKWFGVLVPQSLRSAQSNLKESVCAAVHVASLQNELNALSNEYKSLIQRKRLLKEEQQIKKPCEMGLNEEERASF